MGILKLVLAIGLLAVIIGAVIKLLPDMSNHKSEFEACPKCGGTGTIEELRGKVKCHVCHGTGRKGG